MDRRPLSGGCQVRPTLLCLVTHQTSTRQPTRTPIRCLGSGNHNSSVLPDPHRLPYIFFVRYPASPTYSLPLAANAANPDGHARPISTDDAWRHCSATVGVEMARRWGHDVLSAPNAGTPSHEPAATVDRCTNMPLDFSGHRETGSPACACSVRGCQRSSCHWLVPQLLDVVSTALRPPDRALRGSIPSVGRSVSLVRFGCWALGALGIHGPRTTPPGFLCSFNFFRSVI